MANRESIVTAPQVFGIQTNTELLSAPTNAVKKDWSLLKVWTDGDLTFTLKDDTVVVLPGAIAGTDFGIQDVKLITSTGNVLVS